MNPREIEVHIEELVLHGFDPAKRYDIADSLSAELRSVLAARGLPEGWRQSAPELRAPPVRLTNRSSPTNAIAAALLHSLPGK